MPFDSESDERRPVRRRTEPTDDENSGKAKTILIAASVIVAGVVLGLCVAVPVVLSALDTVRRAAAKQAEDKKAAAQVAPKAGPDDRQIRDVAEHEIVDLVDNTRSYKGKTLRMKLSLVPLVGGIKLRESAGKLVRFRAWSRMAKADLRIIIPEGIPLPNAEDTDDLIVTFECKMGHLETGNVAVAVARPSP